MSSFDSYNYDTINTKSLTSIDTSSNNIYYLFDYYKKWWMDKYPDRDFYKNNFFTFIAVKQRKYNSYSRPINFPAALCNFFKLLKDEWIVCTVPGHEKTLNESNGVYDVLRMAYLNSNITIRNTIIQRTCNVDKKSISTVGRNSDYKVDMKSLGIEPGFSAKGKNIVVVDDITTTGCSLIACKALLLNAGAKKVVLLALGKTKEPEYGY